MLGRLVVVGTGVVVAWGVIFGCVVAWSVMAWSVMAWGVVIAAGAVMAWVVVTWVVVTWGVATWGGSIVIAVLILACGLGVIPVRALGRSSRAGQFTSAAGLVMLGRAMVFGGAVMLAGGFASDAGQRSSVVTVLRQRAVINWHNGFGDIASAGQRGSRLEGLQASSWSGGTQGWNEI